MHPEWSEKNKTMQSLLKKATFDRGIGALLDLRRTLIDQMLQWRSTLAEGEFALMPFPGDAGYHSKTVAYSIWHIMRIEDIVVQTLILDREEVFFSGAYQEKTASPLITTGNELAGEEIAAFSRALRIDGLYDYARAVRESTDAWLRSMDSGMLKRRFSEADKERIRRLGVVSPDEKAAWLVDYWGGKDVAGLIRMPLSRHWIMHVEAAERIIGKIKETVQPRQF